MPGPSKDTTLVVSIVADASGSSGCLQMLVDRCDAQPFKAHDPGGKWRCCSNNCNSRDLGQLGAFMKLLLCRRLVMPAPSKDTTLVVDGVVEASGSLSIDEVLVDRIPCDARPFQGHDPGGKLTTYHLPLTTYQLIGVVTATAATVVTWGSLGLSCSSRCSDALTKSDARHFEGRTSSLAHHRFRTNRCVAGTINTSAYVLPPPPRPSL